MIIIASEKRVTLDRVAESIGNGRSLATAVETILDQEFIEKYRNDWCWTGNENAPAETGWYKTDRTNQKLIKVSREEAGQLTWHERVFVYRSALAAVKEGGDLALYIGGKYDDGRVEALYLCGPDYLAWVATK